MPFEARSGRSDAGNDRGLIPISGGKETIRLGKNIDRAGHIERLHTLVNDDTNGADGHGGSFLCEHCRGLAVGKVGSHA